jgi:PhzF family phenazine biosynthesis protein
MGQRIIQVDSFTDRAFAGNPAAVCVMEKARDAAWMQNVAREMNLSETAFVVPRAGASASAGAGAGDGALDLRWFTPAVEVDLCGHATLAAAHVLWESKRLREDQAARFETKSGTLTCVKKDRWIEMDFPATAPAKAPAPAGMLEALGVKIPGFVGRTRFDYLVEVASEQELRAMAPDFGKLKRAEARGVIVTSRATASKEFDFVSRFFAPQAGVDEDPVTGSAHCALAPFWRERLAKDSMVGYQASARGGIVRVNVRGDRIILGGQAITVLRGELVE